MESHVHIVKRLPVRQSSGAGRSGDAKVEVLNAWLWSVSEPAKDATGEDTGIADIEVSLLPKTRHLLRDFPAPGLERPFLRHLEQRILRDPRDLLSHVRRVLVASAVRDTDATPGALADLFLVLGKHGRGLRVRLFELVEGQLSASQRRFFARHIENGLDATEAMPDLPQSRLSKRVLGTTQIVVRPNNGGAAIDEPVTLARESMDKGRWEVAQALLEGALDSDPGDKDVCEELLRLYRRRSLRSSFFKTYTALLGRRLAFPERWAQLAADYRAGAARNG